VAASFQRAAIDTLVARTLGAARKERSTSIVVAGGVGANAVLRSELARRFDGRVFYPRPEFCTDNGAMIAIAGACRMADAAAPGTIEARARWPLESLQPPATNGRERNAKSDG
jgi:N6-L-threonylcarbamoyladenine synthase